MPTAKNRSILLLFLLASGCTEALETGYMPRRLNANESERRSFYAPQYMPESQRKSQPTAPDLGLGR